MKNRRLSVSSLRSIAPRASIPGIRRRPSICAASIALLAAAVSHSAHAASGTWTSLVSGTLWSDSSAWLGSTIADGTDSSALFNTLDITAATTVQLDSARTIGSLVFADTAPGTAASWTLGNNAIPANILTMAGAAPSINVSSLGTGSTLTIGTVLAGTNGLTFGGTGTILMAGNIGSTYTGGTLLSTRVETSNNNTAAALTIFGSAVATNTLTFDGGYFKIANSNGTPNAGTLVNNMVCNTTGTFEMSARSATSGTLTGSGIFNVITHFIRSDNSGNWSGFTGTINISSGDVTVADFRQTAFYLGFGGATVNLGTNINMYVTNNQNNNAVPYSAASSNWDFGALSGVSSATLRGGPQVTRVLNIRIGAKNVDSDYAGAIIEATTTGLTDILKLGTGKLTLSGGSSAYDGPTRVDAGTLAVAVLANGGLNSSIGRSVNTADRLILNGGTFQYIGTGSSTNRLLTVGTTSAVTLDASGSDAVNFTNAGSIVLTGASVARTITFGGTNTNDNTFSPIIPDNGAGLTALAKSGAGTWVLAGANSYTGVTSVNGGVLSVSSLAPGGSPSNIGAAAIAAANLVVNGGTLRYTGAGATTDRGFTAGVNGATLDASGTGALNLNGAAAVGLTGTDAARTITLTGTAVGDNKLAATIGDNGIGATSLTKAGAGRWIINGANTYSGGTTINNGILSVQNTTGSGTGTGSVTVNSGGILGGTGSISGVVTTLTGGKVDPGASVGTLTVGGITLNTGTVLDYEFNLSPNNDKLVVSNSGGLTLNSVGFNLFAEGTANTFSSNGTYNLIQYSGAIGGTGLDASWTTVSPTNPHILNPAGGRTYVFGTTGTVITLTIASTANVGTWNVNAGGSWGDPGNWSGGVPNAQSDTANFLNAITSPQTVNLDGDKTVGTIQFANTNVASPTVAYTVAQGSGGSLILKNGAAAAQVTVAGSHLISAPVSLVSSAAVDVSAAADTLTVSGAISGAALTKSGNGTLVLTGANTHSSTSIHGGTVEIGTATALGAGVLTFSGSSTLQAGAAALAPANDVVIGNGVTATIDSQAHTITLGSVIGDTAANGALRKTGTGTLVLGTENTYGGPTTVAAGTLSASVLADGDQPSSVGQSPSAAANLVLNGGTLAYTGAGASSNRLFTVGTTGATLDASGTGALNLTSTGAVVLSGTNTARTLTLAGTNTGDNTLAASIGDNLAGATSLAKSGAGTWVLGHANTFTGTTVIPGGILKLGNSLALQNSTLDYNNQGGTLSFGALTTATVGTLTGSQNLALNNDFSQAVTLTVANAQTAVYAGQLSDGSAGSSLTKTGAGLFILTGANSYKGATTVNGGTLQLDTGGVIDGGVVQINPNGTLTVNDGTLIASALSNVNNNSGGVTLNVNSGSATFNGGLNAIGNTIANWVINANGGTLTAASMSLGRSGIAFTTEPATGATGVGLNINGGTVHVTGALSMGIVAGANSSVSVLLNSGSLTVDGALTIGLNNGGRWSVVDVNGGTLTSTDVGSGILIGGPLAGNALLLVRAGTATAEIIKMGTAATGTSVINLTGGSLYIGSGGIVPNTLPGNTVLATIKLAGGILGATADWSSTIDMQVNGSPTVQTADAANVPHDITLGGALSGAGTLTKTGLGKLTLAGAQTYAVLNATEGRTDVSGSFTTGTSIVNVSDNAKVNFGADQTLDTLTVGEGSVVTVGTPLPPAPAPAPAESFAEPGFASEAGGGVQGVPEPGSAALVFGGMLTLLGLRRRRIS